ncbi:monovalent cation/H+ antiporter complex subunit F [Patulibacter americanus]|uniref:monovalent cation/H+ antiporter complex subunit F n=1 Tax=Patulibacter americanus TaxID=588672 RepID=UPI0003B6B5DF|nr:monovalent cation/H+ antiporter complex subunit F [Patulibacter americanus]
MTVVLWIAATMLALAAVLSIVRVVRGPSALDRAVAMDVLLSCAIGGIGLEAAYGRHGTTLPVLAVLALLGFVGSVAIARFGAGLGDDDPEPGASTGGAPAASGPLTTPTPERRDDGTNTPAGGPR